MGPSRSQEAGCSLGPSIGSNGGGRHQPTRNERGQGNSLQIQRRPTGDRRSEGFCEGIRVSFRCAVPRFAATMDGTAPRPIASVPCPLFLCVFFFSLSLIYLRSGVRIPLMKLSCHVIIGNIRRSQEPRLSTGTRCPESGLNLAQISTNSHVNYHYVLRLMLVGLPRNCGVGCG